MKSGLIGKATLDRLLQSRREFDARYRDTPQPIEAYEFEPSFQFRRFEMTAALAVGGSATAYMIVRNAADTAWERKSPEVAFTVHDFQNRFAKPATTAGAYGFAIKPFDQPDWEIVSMQIPQFVLFELQEILTRADTGPVTAEAAQYVGFDTGIEEIDLYDSAAIFQGEAPGDGDGDGVAAWDVRTSRWEIVYMQPNLQGGTTFDVTVPGGTRSLTVPAWVTVGGIT